MTRCVHLGKNIICQENVIERNFNTYMHRASLHYRLFQPIIENLMKEGSMCRNE